MLYSNKANSQPTNIRRRLKLHLLVQKKNAKYSYLIFYIYLTENVIFTVLVNKKIKTVAHSF